MTIKRKGFSMGKTFNSHFGIIEMPSDIFRIGMFDDFMELECEDGTYRIYKNPYPEKHLIIEKIS